MVDRIQVLGTMSGVGKSTIATGLCRWFARRGTRVAPFKALNLASRSVRLSDGSELGIGQAVQAAACGVEPDSRMNPILLKPDGGRTRCFICGRESFSYAAFEFARRNRALRADALRAYEALASEYELIVLEGSGSCCEPNLFGSDVANGWMGEAADAPAILVADMERGGVFAQVCGTLALLPGQWRARIRGIVVNKFHGDPVHFREGAALLAEKAGLPVLGVLPWREGGLPEEDGAFAVDWEAARLRASLSSAVFEATADFLEQYVDLPQICNFARIQSGRN